jgi:SAM-dependent methyltransferase
LSISALSEASRWDEQYRARTAPVWDTGRPSSELLRFLAETRLRHGRALELGCGTGTNAVWLAEQGFEVTAVDVSNAAIARARRRASRRGVRVHFLVTDLRRWDRLGGPFDFFFDRGCYHAVRLHDVAGYLDTLDHVTRKGAVGLVLAGNAAEPEDTLGPPRVCEAELRRELGKLFEIVQLRSFRFDAATGQRRYLGWSCWLHRPV